MICEHPNQHAGIVAAMPYWNADDCIPTQLLRLDAYVGAGPQGFLYYYFFVLPRGDLHRGRGQYLDKCIYNSNLKFCYTSPSVHESLSDAIKIVHKPDIDVDSSKAKQLTSLMRSSHIPHRVSRTTADGKLGGTMESVSLVALQTNGASSPELVSASTDQNGDGANTFVVPDVLHCTFQHFSNEQMDGRAGGAVHMDKHQTKVVRVSRKKNPSNTRIISCVAS